MKSAKIKPLAICVILDQDKILVQEGYDYIKKEKFYRPLGGKIKFGELGSQTVTRELREEIHAEIEDIQYLGVIESIFTYNGMDCHEIVLIYAANLINPEEMKEPIILGRETDGDPIKAVWLPLSEYLAYESDSICKHTPPIYPEGLLEMVLSSNG